MIRFWGVILTVIVASISVQAGGDIRYFGGRAASLAGITVISEDEWSAGNNPAGLACQKNLWAGIYYENRFLIRELSAQSLTLILPVKTGAFGSIFSYTGSSLYNEMMAGFSYGRNFGKAFSAGLRLHYTRIHIGMEYGNKNLVNFSAGFHYRPGNQIIIGIQILNPVPVKIGKDANETLPMVYLAGISWQTSRSILLSVEGGKETDQKAIGRFGLEYHIAKPAWIRVGILSQPVEFTFGAGIASGKFRFDLSSSWHRILGYSFQSSVSYSFF